MNVIHKKGFFSQKKHGGYNAEFLKEELAQANKNMQTENEIPRRNRLDLNTPAELAIHNAMQEVEKLAADTRLTDAINLLQQAKDKVSDFVDNP